MKHGIGGTHFPSLSISTSSLGSRIVGSPHYEISNILNYNNQHECYVDKSAAAQRIEDEFGTDKALDYPIEEKSINFLEAAGTQGGRTRLRVLITDVESECCAPAGYPGRAGELWYVRLCLPIEPVAYHLAFTAPYVLMDFGRSDWMAHLSKSLMGLAKEARRSPVEVTGLFRVDPVHRAFRVRGWSPNSLGPNKENSRR
jgi:hypothetical protein